MSDPYGSNPYGGQNPPPPPPQPNPYGSGGGYGAPYGGFPGGSEPQPPKTDGVSIASFVLSLLCCTGLIGLILGFVGLKRTKGGQRKGRGFAIAGIVLGVLSLFVVAGVVVFGVFIAKNVVTPGNAEVGQCVDVSDDDDTVVFYKKKCTEDHDAEIVGVQKVTDDNIKELKSSLAGYCATVVPAEDLAKLTEYSSGFKAVIEDPDDVSVGDHLVCYVEPGEKLDKPLL